MIFWLNSPVERYHNGVFSETEFNVKIGLREVACESVN